MKKCLIVLLLLFTVILSGCSINPDVQAGDNFGVEEDSAFIFVEKLGDDYYIIADKKNNYEYYATCVHAKFSDSYVIGGNVLDDNGQPKKYSK